MSKATLVKVWLFVLGMGILLNFVVPPFQNPDEPNHFGAVMIYAWGEDQKPAVEAEIIRFMDKNNWWKHLGMGRPAELPSSLSDIPFLMENYPAIDFRVRLNNIVLYHFGVGKGIGLLGLKDVTLAYYLCRFISFLFTAGAIFLSVLALQKISQKYARQFIWGIFFIVFLPQFLLGMVTVNADAMAVFLGALFFYGLVSLVMGEMKKGYAAAIILSAVLGFFTDRSTFILIPLGILVLFFLIRKNNYQEYVVSVLTFLIVFFALASLLINLFPLQAESSLTLFGRNFGNVGEALPLLFSFGEFSREFIISAMDGFLFKFGWACFSAAKVFYFVWRTLVMCSMIGIGIILVKFIRNGLGKRKNRPATGINAKLCIFFTLSVLFQITAAWTYYGSHKIIGQGRYFFPLLLPVAYLFVTGTKSFFDTIKRGYGTVSLPVFILLEFFFLNAVIWQYMIPVFHMTIKSANLGI